MVPGSQSPQLPAPGHMNSTLQLIFLGGHSQILWSLWQQRLPFCSHVLLWSHPWRNTSPDPHLVPRPLHLLAGKSSLISASAHIPTLAPCAASWAPVRRLALAWSLLTLSSRSTTPLCRAWPEKTTDHPLFMLCQPSYHFIPLFSHAYSSPNHPSSLIPQYILCNLKMLFLCIL